MAVALAPALVPKSEQELAHRLELELVMALARWWAQRLAPDSVDRLAR
jgi:hypothetical protein